MPVVPPKLAASARFADRDPAHAIVTAAAAMMASLCIVYSSLYQGSNERFSEGASID